MKKNIILLILSLACLGLFAQGTIVIWGSPHTQLSKNVPAGEDFIDIAAGKQWATALRSNGTVTTWGQTSQMVSANPPGNDYTAITAGEQHAVALRSDGTLVAWGFNNKGQLDVPTHSDFVKISAGLNHTLALRADGTVVAWGDNALNQCNVPAGTYTDIAAGDAFSLAINTAGEIIGWGSPWNNRLDIPAGNNFVQVASKNLHSIARRSDGSIVAWGNAAAIADTPTSGTYVDIAAGWQGSIAIRDDGELVAWANLWALKTIPAWVQDLDIVKVSGGEAYFLGLTGVFGESDGDGDGVADSLDDFPTDALRAYKLSYPLTSPTGWGTLAYEDMWPQQGDYDFNDLVLDYKLNLVLDADMKIKDINGDFMLRAVGATFQNAFAIEFPFPASNVENHSGIGAGAAYNMPILEAGVNSILKVISSTNDFVDVPGGGIFWNTQLEQPNYDPIPISFQLTLVEPLDQSSLPFWGIWNPYLMVNRVQGYEIHLPGFPPTVHANTALFGLDDDTTNPALNRYYKTDQNLPWALDLPIHWKYPIEQKEISQAYYRFAPWAESGGSLYPDWYELDSSDVNLNFIYNP